MSKKSKPVNPQDYQIIQSHGDNWSMPIIGFASEADVIKAARRNAEVACAMGLTAHYRVFGPNGYITSYVSVGRPCMYEHTDVTIPSMLGALAKVK